MLRTKIAEIRKEKNISQQELADAVDVRRETISHLENGRYNPSLKLAMMICHFLDKKVEEVFRYDFW